MGALNMKYKKWNKLDKKKKESSFLKDTKANQYINVIIYHHTIDTQWVGQKVDLGFSIRYYKKKNSKELFGQPKQVNWNILIIMPKSFLLHYLEV